MAYGEGAYGEGVYGGGTRTYSSEVLADSPLAFYLLDEASGTTAADSSGNGRDASYNGTITYGLAGPSAGIPASIQTASSVSWVEMPTMGVGTIAGTQPQSWEIWFYAPGEVTASTAGIYLIGTKSTGNTYPIALGASTGNLSSEVVSIGTTDSGGTFGARTGWVSPLTISAGWHHLVITFNGARNGWRLFIDATEVTSGKVSYAAGGTAGAAGMPTNCIPAIGRFVTNYSAVRVAGLAVYDTELSPTRVAAHYDAASLSGGVTFSGTVAATLPALGASITGAYGPSATLTAVLPPLGAVLAGESYPPGVAGDLVATLPPLGGSLVGAYSDTATLAAILPPLSASFAGTAGPPPVTGSLAAVLPSLRSNLAGQSFKPGTEGYVEAFLPALTASLSGDVLGRAGLGLALDSSAVLTVEAALEPEPTVPPGTPSTALHIIAPTVPVPTLVAGRPQ